jgi:hypothetical protein
MRLGAVVAAIAAAPAHAGDWVQMSLKFGPYPVIEVY